MKKALIAFFAVVMLTTLFTSCPGGGSAGGPVTLTVGIWDQNQAPGIQQVLDDFTAETGIRTTLQVTPWGDYWTLLEAAATGGALPDVMWMHSNQVQRYMAGGQLLDLTSRIQASNVANMANFPRDIVDLYSRDGSQYGIPKDVDTIALWYNRRMFDAAGVSYPTNDWTWDDVLDAARRLSNPAAGQYGIVFFPPEVHTGYWNHVFQAGGYIISPDRRRSGFDNPSTIEALEWVVNLTRQGLSPPLDHGESDMMALMTGEVVAMAQFGSWMLSAFKQSDFFIQNCDMVMLPSGPADRATIYNGLAWSAAANTPYQEEAWRLLEYFSREDVQTKLSVLGVAISAYNGTAAPFVASFPEFNAIDYVDQLRYAVMRPWSINQLLWEDMSIRLLNDAWAGTRPVADVAREIAQQMNAMLAAE